MVEQLLSPEYIVFAVAFAVMLGIGLIEAVGLGVGTLDLDGDPSGFASWPFLEWLGLRSGMPILIWLTSLLACFTFAGLAVQQIAGQVSGAPFAASLAALIALGVALPANAFASGVLAAIMPEFESSVVDSESLLRRRGTVLEGSARRGSPARAKVIDQHGQAHYVMIEPHDDADVIQQGQTAMLVRKDGPLFFALPETSTALGL